MSLHIGRFYKEHLGRQKTGRTAQARK
jgi:hypothetical protein